MDEYLSKQKVLDYLNGYLHSLGEGGADDLLFDRGQRRALINAIQDISAVKTADVQPVKHGHWDYSEKENGECAWYFCSECDLPAEQLYDNSPLLSEFCPHCGVRMDGDKECHDTK